MDKAIKKMTKKSSNIGIYREDLLVDGQFFFFDIFRPELLEMKFNSLEKDELSSFFTPQLILVSNLHNSA